MFTIYTIFTILKNSFKGPSNVILSDPSFVLWHVQITTLPLKSFYFYLIPQFYIEPEVHMKVLMMIVMEYTIRLPGLEPKPLKKTEFISFFKKLQNNNRKYLP